MCVYVCAVSPEQEVHDTAEAKPVDEDDNPSTLVGVLAAKRPRLDRYR